MNTDRSTSRCRAATALVATALSLAAVQHARGESNFSQYPGFAEYFAANPRSRHAASPAEQRLVRAHRPRLYIGPAQEGPISFYDDYIAQGVLRGPNGVTISDSVTRDELNRHRADPRVVFEHIPSGALVSPVVFGRVDRRAFPALGELTFLTYHFVFRQSGIPAGVTGWRQGVLKLAGNADDWHQLDHYTAATLVLDENEDAFALLLQQHNYLRSFLLDCDLPAASEGRVRLVAALRSNELYPYLGGRVRWRAVSFMTPQTLPYLVHGEDEPIMSGDDVTQVGREVQYRLDYVSPSDAFYSFAGYLGERRALPGRDGPPGADFNTLPRFKPLELQLVAFNWREGDRDHATLLTELYSSSQREESRAFEHSVQRLQDRFLERHRNCR